MSHEPDSPQGRLWERWEEVDALLEAVLDQPRDERLAWIGEKCADDEELRDLVLVLVAEEDEGGGGWLSASPPLVQAALGVAEVPGRDATELIGSMAGPYRLLEILGAGGMGTVYRAERADGAFEREVAVKVLHPELARPAVLERFQREGQILASLRHPAVAHMLDGGTTSDGRPFIVMEFVEGLPIVDWARSQQLGIEERIDLVLQVCDAVEHAHRHLVVHRDLKPTNILVDAAGKVKLLDFGIAKLLAEADEEAAGVTRADARFVTPEYAAPEQLLGEPVSTQTDVYALGGLLYELLTGRRPYERRAEGSVLERMIRGDEPTAPSTNVGEPAVVPGMEPHQLRRRLGGDLDAILLRALQTRPESRYASVAAFRDELERHRSGRPVLARGDARWYVVRRFVRRHLGPVAAAAGVVLVLAGSALGLAVQQRAAQAAAEQAAREAETARQVTEFLVGLFDAAEPEMARTDSVSVQTVLARGAERIDSLAGQPAVQAELLEALGRVHASLGDFDVAVPMLERAVAAREAAQAPDSIRAATLMWLGSAHSSGRSWSLALDPYRAALPAAGTKASLRGADAHAGLANAFTFLGALDSAEVHAEANVDLREELGERTDAARITLASILRRRGNDAGAERIYRETIAEQRSDPHMSPVQFSTVLNNLAVLLRTQERYEEAYGLYREAVDTLEALVGPGHPETLMVAGNLATTTLRLGRLDETLDIYGARAEAAAETWPDGHWRRADVLFQFGAQLADLERYEEAIPILSEALDMGIAELGATHSWNAIYRGWLALAAMKAERVDPATQLFGWSWEGLAAHPGLADDQTMTARVSQLADALEGKGLTEEAARYRSFLEPAA